MQQTTQRAVSRVITAHRQTEGGGFVVRRPFPTHAVDHVDPFLLLDEMGPAHYKPGEAVGAPDHPHRGFETVTYMLEGAFEHVDSAGHRGRIDAGDVQWMTAGAGVIHSEMPSREIIREGGTVHGFQIWVNLPARDKLMRPRYQEVPASRIPKASTPDGLARVAVIAGEALGVKAVIDTRIPILYHDWTLEPGADLELPTPTDFRLMAYVFAGKATIAGREIVDGQLAVLDEGESLTLSVAIEEAHKARLLLLGGQPLREPVARYGPFVMNTREEIEQAFNDYRSGRFGEIR